jgi:hypothetical protein
MKMTGCRSWKTRGAGIALTLSTVVAGWAANAVPDAATVPVAPVVERPLEPAMADVPGEAPSPQHRWVPGHWRWQEGAFVWEAGRWHVPPAANLAWQAPQWQRTANGYVLRDGRWVEAATVTAGAPPPAPVTTSVAPPVSAPPPQTVIVQPTPAPQVIVMAPPPPRREVVYVRPSPRHVWLPGYWAWRGNRYVWIGHYVVPPPGRRGWVEPRWERRSGTYIFIEGHWR